MEFDPSTAFDPSSASSGFDPSTAFDPTTVQEETKPKKSLGKEVLGDVTAIGDMVLGLPYFLGKMGVRGLADVGYALSGSDKPLEEAGKLVDEAGKTPYNRFMAAPLETSLGVFGVKNVTDDTVVSKIFNAIGEGVASAGEGVTGTSEGGEAAKQIFDVGLAAIGNVGGKKIAGKAKTEPLPTIDELHSALSAVDKDKVFAREPADMFPETQKTPYGTTTGEKPKFEVDENGMPVNRELTNEVQQTEMKPLSDQFAVQGELNRLGNEAPLSNLDKPDTGFEARQQELFDNISKELTLADQPKENVSTPDNTIPFEKVDPNSLKETQTPLDFKPVDEGVQYKPYASPEQGAEFIKTLENDLTEKVKANPSQFDLPNINQPLGQSGFGKGQRGAINLFGTSKPKTLEERALSDSFDSWLPEYNKAYPQYAKSPEVAQAIYTKLNDVNNKVNLPKMGKTKEQSGFLKALDYGLGTWYARVGGINSAILQRAVDYDLSVLQRPHEILSKADDFLVKTNKFPEGLKNTLNKAVLDNNTTKVLDTLKNANQPELAKAYVENIRNPLNELGREAQHYGVIDNFRENFFPRIVKDYTGLVNAMGRTEKTGLDKALGEAQLKASAKGEMFDDVARSEVINKYLRGYGKESSKPGYSKNRVFGEIPEELVQFYATPAESFHMYTRKVVDDIETAKFFGRSAKKNPDGTFNLNDSIGSYVNKELQEGRLAPEKVAELDSLLRSRFVTGKQSPGALVQTFKNLASSTLLSDATSTAIQFLEIAPTMALNGVSGTLKALVAMATGNKRFKAEDLGFVDNLAEEFINTGSLGKNKVDLKTAARMSSKWVHQVFKLNFFHTLDVGLKSLALNAASFGAEAKLGTPARAAEFKAEWEPRFGDKYPQLVSELKAGKVTPLTTQYAYSQIVKTQALTRGNLPQAGLDAPNARLLYTLKTFAINQANLLRTEGIRKIQQGRTKEGLKTLGAISLALYINGAGSNLIRNFLLGRDQEEFNTSDIPLSLLKLFSYSDYTNDALKNGEPGKALMSMISPPITMLDRAGSDAMKDAFGEGDSEKRYLDVLPYGKSIRNRFYGGAETYNDKQESRSEE